MNNISSINGNNNTYRIDNDTLSRAILTFCIDGADAIMYTLVIGSVNTGSIVEALHLICESISESIGKTKNKQLELNLQNGCCQDDFYIDGSLENQTKSNLDDLENNGKILNIIKNHSKVSVLEEYFLKGLKIWGSNNADNKIAINNFDILH
ncbi:MAG: DNA processing protein DprA, partial [Gardnerella vaginalis]